MYWLHARVAAGLSTLESALPVLAALACFACQEAPVTGAVDPSPCAIDFEAAGADASSRDAYFNALTQCDPAVRKARDSGTVVKVLYAPDSARIRKELKEGYGALGYSPADIAFLSEVTLAGSLETEGAAMAEISSTNFGFFAKGLPVFILAFEKIFSWPQGINRFDLESILLHEIQHARDWHDGIKTGAASIGNLEVAEGTFGAEWTVQLMELRAVFRELDAAYEPKARVDSFHISGPWFASRAEAYSIHWRKVDSLARTDAEIAAGAAQKREFEGIVPEFRADTLLLRFNRYGRSLTAVFNVAPAPKAAAEAGARTELAFMRWQRGEE